LIKVFDDYLQFFLKKCIEGGLSIDINGRP